MNNGAGIEVSTRIEDEVAWMSISGEISFKQIPAIRERVDALLNQSLKALVVDLSNVSYIDSTGLSVIMRCHAHMLRTHNKCIILGAQGPVSRIFKMMRLENVLTLVDTPEQAEDQLN